MAGAESLVQLKKQLLYAVGKYSDYRRYKCTLSALEDEYDETLELYNLDIWYSNSNGTIRDKAAHMLEVTTELFQDLESNAEIELYHVMEEIMELDEEEQLQIWDMVLNCEKMTEDEFGEIMIEWSDFEYNQDAALKSFMDYLKSCVEEGETYGDMGEGNPDD